MSPARTLAVTLSATLAAVVASGAFWIVEIMAAVSAWCSENESQAACDAKGSSAIGAMIVFGVLGAVVITAIVYAVIRVTARPRTTHGRWHLLCAVALVPMPTVALLAGLVISHHGPAAVTVGLAIALAWMATWALVLRWLHDLALRRQTGVGEAAVAT